MAGNFESNTLSGLWQTPSLMLLSECVQSVPETALSILLKHVFVVIEKGELPHRFLEKLARKDVENYENLFGGLIVLVTKLLREKPENMKENDLRLCLKSLKFSEDCSNTFMNLFIENRDALFRARKIASMYYFTVKKVDWRIDISISSSGLNKSVNTLIIVRIICNNDETKVFELNIAKFHILRLYVASMLKEMLNDKKHSVLK